MKLLAIAGLLIGCCAASACLTASRAPDPTCDTGSLQSILDDPINYDGKTYCGAAFIRRHAGTVRVLVRADEEPSMDLALLVTTNGWGLLGNIDSVPRQYYIEARVELQAECFREHSDNEETCNPFWRPILLHLRSARPNTE